MRDRTCPLRAAGCKASEIGCIKGLRRLALLSAVSALALGAGGALAQEVVDAGWSAHGSLTARAGTERHIGELDLFLPLWQDDSAMLFGDLRAQTDDDGNQEGNAGLGYRAMGESWIVGGYGFFDYRKSDETGNSFMQGTLGVEALSETLDLRANFYIPEGGEQAAPGFTALQVVGGSLQMRAGFERALPGVDGEIGYRLWQSQGGGGEIRAFAGGYYFDAADYDTVAGARGRVEARLFDLDFLGAGSRFTLGAEVTQDNVRDTQGFAVARLTIPFGGGRRSGRGGLDRRMTDYVVRDVDIITSAATTGAVESVNYAGSDAAVGTVTVLAAPDDIVAATAAGGVGDLFVVDGSAGTFDTVASIVLQDGQMLAGGGGGVAVVGMNSGARSTYTAPGARGTINGNVNGAEVVTLANNVIVTGLDINNSSLTTGSHAIRGHGASGVVVTGNNIATAGSSIVFGVYLSGASSTNWLVANNNITSTGDGAHGLVVAAGFGNMLSGNSISTSGVGSKGLWLSTSTGNTVDSNIISTSGFNSHGIELSSAADNNFISRNNVSTAGDNSTGILLAGVSALDVTNNAVATGGTGSLGVVVSGVSGSLFSGNSITTTGDAYGFFVREASSNLFNNNAIATSLSSSTGMFLSGGATDGNAGTGNSYSGPAPACIKESTVTGTNTIDLCQ